MSSVAEQPIGLLIQNEGKALEEAFKIIQATEPNLIIVPNVMEREIIKSLIKCNIDPILIDINPQNIQLDLDLLDEFLSNFTHLNDQDELILKKNKRRIAGIMIPHLAGIIPNMDRLHFIKKRFSIPIIEECNQVTVSRLLDKQAGCFSDISIFQTRFKDNTTELYHEVLLVNNKKMIDQVKDHISKNANANIEVVSNIESVLGINHKASQQRSIDKIKKGYFNSLSKISDIQFLEDPETSFSNYPFFTFYHPKQKQILAALEKNDIIARPFWKPMNQLEMFKDNLYIHKKDHSDDIYQHCLSIPSSVSLSEEEQEKVIQTIKFAITKS